MIPTIVEKDSQLPKLIGADIELANFILGASCPDGTFREASRAVLAEIEGLPSDVSSRTGWSPCVTQSGFRGHHGNLGYYADQERGVCDGGFRLDTQDWGRKFLSSNSGCAYIDLDHLELCVPETLSAYSHVACWHAMLRIARRALRAANQNQPPGRRIQVHVNNSDGMGNSYGSHVNFLITRRAWDNIFERKLHLLLWLASYQVSSIIFTGGGKVGSEDDEAETTFQLSQRADFYKTLVGPRTTFDRPLVNSRDEALCGSGHNFKDPDRGVLQEMARLHVIFFDNTLCHVSTLLKVGVMQILLAQIEAERIKPNLILDDPVHAVKSWSRDPTLKTRARLTSGEELTAVELQFLFLEEARKFVEQGHCDGIVPHASDILSLWEDTLLKLQARDFAGLAGRLDWVLKWRILNRAMQQQEDLRWGNPKIKHLDHLYSSLDEEEGLYWAYEKSGALERLATDAQVDWFTENPPEDSRAWTRAMLLRAANPGVVDDVGWDFIRFKFRDGYWFRCRRIDLANPLAYTKALAEPVFKHAAQLDELIDALGELGSMDVCEPVQVQGKNAKPVVQRGDYNEFPGTI